MRALLQSLPRSATFPSHVLSSGFKPWLALFDCVVRRSGPCRCWPRAQQMLAGRPLTAARRMIPQETTLGRLSRFLRSSPERVRLQLAGRDRTLAGRWRSAAKLDRQVFSSAERPRVVIVLLALIVDRLHQREADRSANGRSAGRRRMPPPPLPHLSPARPCSFRPAKVWRARHRIRHLPSRPAMPNRSCCYRP